MAITYEIKLLIERLNGFAFGKDKGRVIELVEGLEMTDDEWFEIMESGLLALDDSDLDEVDEYFENKAKNR